MENLNRLTGNEKDALKEIGNIGTGNAVTALSELLKKRIEMIIPETNFLKINEFVEELGGPESIITCNYFEIGGSFKGEALFILPQNSSKNILSILESEPDSEEFSEKSKILMKNFSNIFVGAYLNSISTFIKEKILFFFFFLADDMLQSVIDFVLAKISNYSDTILSIKTKIEMKDYHIEGNFIVILNQGQ